ncbi:MAG: hypothetical protein NTW85_16315 [Methylococcales bacterium]|nr:hypothetical protein [Methylococcales bacterium]
MTTIKTTLRTRATDHHGNIELTHPDRPKSFGGIYALGLIMGSQDKDTRRLPVDDRELIYLKTALNNVIQDCLFSLQGLGGFIANCQPITSFTHSDLYGLGSVIQNLALLAQESQDHLENIAMDGDSRNQAQGNTHE